MTCPRTTCKGGTAEANGWHLRIPAEASDSRFLYGRIIARCRIRLRTGERPAAAVGTQAADDRSTSHAGTPVTCRESNTSTANTATSNPADKGVEPRKTAQRNEHQHPQEASEPGPNRSRCHCTETARVGEAREHVWIYRLLRGGASRMALLESRPADNCTEPVCRKPEK